MRSVFVHGGGGLSATGEIGAARIFANCVGALLACLHHYHHWHCSHCSHHRRHRRRLQGGIVRCWRVVPATMAAAPMIPAVPAEACQDGGGI